MAVTYDASTTLIGNVTNSSVSHTVTTGLANTVLYVAIGVDNTTDINPVVKYAGATVTQIAENTGTGRYLWVGQLVAPASGANTLTASVLSTTSWMMIITSYGGVDQATPNDTASVFNTASATSFSTTLSSATGNICAGWLCLNGNNTITNGAGQTARVSCAATSVGAQLYLTDEVGAASVTLSISWATPAALAAFVCFDINAAAAATVAGGILSSGVFGDRIFGTGVFT